MKKSLLLLFVFNFITPLYAQLEWSRVAKQIRQGRLLTQPSAVSYSSQRANTELYRQLTQVPRTLTSLPTDFKQGHNFRSTFQIQHTDSPLAKTSSAFAIDLLNNGKVQGVTAGHVMRSLVYRHKKVDRKPYIRVETGPNSFMIVPIEKFYIGNPDGLDIALFEIPQEVLPYITVLHPAEQPPSPGQEITIQGFLEEQAKPFTLSRQKVLFSTPLRIVLEKTPTEDMRGACGSPGFSNGGVSMVHIGSDSVARLIWYDWYKNLPIAIKRSMSSMLYGVPIDVVKSMAKSIEENGSVNEGGIMMKVLGHPVALLHLNESIVSIEQFRNGASVAKITSFRHFAANPEQLELFFNLQEDDVLRISLNEFFLRHPFPSVSLVYDVNVSTGQVTKLSEEEVQSYVQAQQAVNVPLERPSEEK